MNTFIRFLLIISFNVAPFFSLCQTIFVPKDKTPYVITEISGAQYVTIENTVRKEYDTIYKNGIEAFLRNPGHISIVLRNLKDNSMSPRLPIKNKPKGQDCGSTQGASQNKGLPPNLERLNYIEHELDEKNNFPEKRFALLIGNNDYKEFDSLKNTDNDIDGVTGRLKKLGFDVYSLYNAQESEMKSAINMFIDTANTNKYNVALFYYAGHGLRLHVNKMDYIIPVDASKDNYKIPYDPVQSNNRLDYLKPLSIEYIIEQCKELTNNNKNVILVIDACRSYTDDPKKIIDYEINPLFDRICVMRSTFPSKTATDRVESGWYTPFATAFINTIGSTGENIDYEFKEIENAVIANSDQHPTINNNIRKEPFFFCKGCISEKMEEEYDDAFKQAKSEFDDLQYGPAIQNFKRLPLSYNDSICTYLALCNYKLGYTAKADSIFKNADSVYKTRFFNEEYGKYLMEKKKYKEAFYRLLKDADTTRAIHAEGFLHLKTKHYDINNAIKDSIGTLYELFAKQDSNDAYLDSAFLWYERSNSPYSRYRRLDLLKNKEISDFWGRRDYETTLYNQMERLMRKFYVADAMYYLGKYNTENEIFTKGSRMHTKGVEGLKYARDIGHKQARRLLDQINSEYNSSHYQHENDTLFDWSKWRNYTKEEWKFTDYSGVTFQLSPKGYSCPKDYKDLVISGHYRHRSISMGFGFGMIKPEKDVFSKYENRRNYIFDMYKDAVVESDAYNYSDSTWEHNPLMVFVEPGFNFSNIVTLSLGVGCVSIFRGFEYEYNVGHDITYKNSIKSNGPYFLLYPQLHLHLLLTEWIHSGFGFGITIDMGYRQIYGKDSEAILNINKIIEQNNGFTCGLGLEFAF